MNKQEVKLIENNIGELFKKSTPNDAFNIAYYSIQLFREMIRKIPRLKQYLIENEFKDAVEFLTNKNPNCELGLYYEECNEYQIGGDCSQCDYYLTSKDKP